MSKLPFTSSQTVGPFFSIGLLRNDTVRNALTQQGTEGLRIRIVGRILDGDEIPVPDALVEIWQANAYGRYNHPSDQSNVPLDPHFSGFGRAGTNAQGEYWFDTIKPGNVQLVPGQWQAPHICATIFARGLLNHLFTRLYFADEPANATDAILQRVPAERRATLLARRTDEGEQIVYRFDIKLQGENETVFLNIG